MWRLVLGLGVTLGAGAAEPALRPGQRLGDLTVGGKVYVDAVLRSADGRSVFFTHSGGLASVRLRDLPPELVRALGYDPERLPPEPAPLLATVAVATGGRDAATERVAPLTPRRGRLEELFERFERLPEFRRRETLQPAFVELGLSAKNQGRRPSCAIFAVVGALEYQLARRGGEGRRISEDYLIWATLRTLGRTGGAAVPFDAQTGEPVADAGFALPSVVAAIRAYGLAWQEEFTNDAGRSIRAIPEPSADLIAAARSRPRAHIAELPGVTAEKKLERVVHALNAGYPVPAGMAWPHERSIRAGVLSEQTPAPGAFHAVTIVGYENTGGRPEDTVFVFRNSYGPRWGQGGYGRATWGYLSRHLTDAYVLEPGGAEG